MVLKTACLLLPLVLAAHDVRAQVTASNQLGALDGDVISIGGVGMARVEVILLDKGARGVRTTRSGAYRMDSVTLGPHLVRFRRLGLKPLTVSVIVRPNETTSVDAVLEEVPHILSGVVVQTSRGDLVRLPDGLAQRMKNGLGHYVTYDEIQRLAPVRASDLLRNIPGVQVSGSGVASNTRGVTSLFDAVDEKGNHTTTTGCGNGMAVYIDGSPVAGADSTSSPLDLVQPSDIVGIEVYKSPVEMSATLPPSPCGAVFVWTRR